MGMLGTLQIGKSGLLASQAALQVVGNNLANLATEGYHRQNITLEPETAQQIGPGMFIGRGVTIQSITRAADEALEARLRNAISDEGAADVRQSLLGRIEAIQNEFTDTDLSTIMSEFFNAFSELSNNPQDMSLRSMVIEQAGTLTSFIRELDSNLGSMEQQTIAQIDQTTATANDLLNRIATLNQQISVQSRGSGGAPSLRDQRDALLAELSQYMDISTVEQESGSVDVFVGSLPIILNSTNRGIEVVNKSIDGETVTQIVISADKSPLDLTSGELGALIEFKEGDIKDAIGAVDELASQLIWQVNRLHSQGQGTELLDGVTTASLVSDPTLTLDDPDNGLAFTPQHGSFQLHVIQQSTGQVVTTTIDIDLDEINPATNTTLNSLAADINAVANVTASVNAAGQIVIDTGTSDFQIAFGDDTSGVLAALGINTFFTGKDAFDIDVNTVVEESPGLIAAAYSGPEGANPGDNSVALSIASLRDDGLDDLNGLSLTEYWSRHVGDFAVRRAQSREELASTTVIREGLATQQQSVSGVNADEETIDLIMYQRAYQASARLLTVIDELMQTLMAAV